MVKPGELRYNLIGDSLNLGGSKPKVDQFPFVFLLLKEDVITEYDICTEYIYTHIYNYTYIHLWVSYLTMKVLGVLVGDPVLHFTKESHKTWAVFGSNQTAKLVYNLGILG